MLCNLTLFNEQVELTGCNAYCSFLCLVFSQGPVLLHSVCKILWTVDKELLCQGIFACGVSSLSQTLSFVKQHSFYSQPPSLSKGLWLVCLVFCPQDQFVILSIRICVPGGFMLATVLGCVCLGIASLIYLAVSWYIFIVMPLFSSRAS